MRLLERVPTQEQIIRLRFIEAMLVLTNGCNRQDICSMFGIMPNAASGDFKRYKEINPGIEYCYQRQRYCKTAGFRPDGILFARTDGNYNEIRFLLAISMITGNDLPPDVILSRAGQWNLSLVQAFGKVVPQ
ncbi:TPA: hypothetical protein LU109_003582 [Enterobacter hormaechei subsp. xiangfangensis]|nr:hypothetical protein [Enterobacter hormaechei subsp. xiangfangensis]